MKKYLSLILLVSLLALVACNKDEPEPAPVPPTNYQPTSVGSYWTYSGYAGGISYNMEMNGQTDSINGYLWDGFNHTILGEGWFRKENGQYYYLYDMNGNILIFPYLKDNASIGYNWETELTMGGVNTLLSYTILERDTSKVVFGQLYKDVIVVQLDQYYDLGSGFDTVNVTGQYWYANDIGFIFSDVNTDGKTYLEFFDIKD